MNRKWWDRSRRVEKVQKIADRSVSLEGVAKHRVGVDEVGISPPVARASEVPSHFEILHDRLSSSLGNPHRNRDVARTNSRVPMDAVQNVGVIRKEGPLGPRHSGTLGGHTLHRAHHTKVPA